MEILCRNEVYFHEVHFMPAVQILWKSRVEAHKTVFIRWNNRISNARQRGKREKITATHRFLCTLQQSLWNCWAKREKKSKKRKNILCNLISRFGWQGGQAEARKCISLLFVMRRVWMNTEIVSQKERFLQEVEQKLLRKELDARLA